MKNKNFLFLFIIMLIAQCGQNPVSTDQNSSYTPLAAGDITQLISVTDSSTILLTVKGTVRRTDHKTVFLSVWQYGRNGLDTSYYFVDDGYFVATDLDSVKNDTLLLKVNPFNEQRLAKSYPQDDDTWLHTPGKPDSYYWTAGQIDKLQVPAGIFENVFAFTLDGILTTVYGQGVGWLGTSTFISSTAWDFVCTYKKISGRIYGQRWPAKDAVIIGTIPKQRAIFKNRILGILLSDGGKYFVNGQHH